MPFFKRVCLPPWQSRFMDTQELILTINTAAVLSKRNIFFIKFSSTDEKITVSWVWISSRVHQEIQTESRCYLLQGAKIIAENYFS
jgi:hypothetical protein